MATRVILVRAVNVGGTARLPMAEFRAMLEELGAQNARTHIASGNDEWAVLGHHLHLRYRKGMSNATLKSDALMKRLGVVGTARNLRTVQAIINLARR